MTYDLEIRFTPPVDRDRFLEHFQRRQRYVLEGRTLAYENPHTQVTFAIESRARTSWALRQVVTAARFEIAYVRPSFFAQEADIELRALLAEFPADIHDPQMRGMGGGPYTPEGFLSGWSFGNEIAIKRAQEHGVELRGLPRDRLQAAWRWNLQHDKWVAAGGDRLFVPHVRPHLIEGATGLGVTWALGMPIFLPEVDHVWVGRQVQAGRAFGLATWAETLAILESAGISTDKRPIEIRYTRTPEPIGRWVASIPAVSMSRESVAISPAEMVDSEALA